MAESLLFRREPRMTVLADHAVGSSQDDLLSLESRLTVVLDILRHCNTRCPITVAIYGDWGTGKTSAMRWLQSQLDDWNKLDSRDRNEHPCVYPVWFDPWKFQTREDVWRGIIAEVILALFRIETLTRETFVPQMIEAAKKFSSFLGKGFLHALAGTEIKIKAGTGGSGAEFGVKGEMFREIYDELEKTVHPEKAYLNEFEETLTSWIQSSIKGGQKQKYHARVALFIDDLDRCSPDVTLEVLEAIKLYLNIEPLVFIVGLDRNVVDAIVGKHYADKGLSPKKSEQYLDKIFQVEIQISPSEQQMEVFRNRQIAALDDATGRYWSNLLEPAHKEVVENGIKGLAKENPREIKRLLNSALLRGRAAADNRDLLGEGRPEKLVFAQGVQFFLIQRIIRNKLSNATGLLLKQEALRWFERLSKFLRDPDHLGFKPPKPEADGEEPEVRRPDVQRVYEIYNEIKSERPQDDEGKQVDMVLLEDKLLWSLLQIPFSKEVAQSAPSLPPPKLTPTTSDIALEDVVGQFPSVIRDRIASELVKPVAQISPADVRDLKKLDLSDSQVADADLKHLAKLPSLKGLSLWDTKIADAGLKHLIKLTSLTNLGLGGTRITDAGLKHLAEIASVKFLTLWGTKITDVGLEHLRALSSLESLGVGGTEITDVGLKQLANFVSLQVLNLRRTEISDAGLEYLANLSNLQDKLQELNLTLTKITDAGLKHLVKLRSLQVLNLRRTEISDAGLEHLANLKLQSLDLMLTKITDAGLRHVASLSSLRDLNLDRTHITDDGLKHLVNLNSLENLELGGTDVTGAGLEHLAKSLKRLELGSTHVTDTGLEHLAKLTSLKSLDLRDNKITDAGVSHLAKLSWLDFLELPGTKITSEGLDKLQTHLPNTSIR
jgi:internalin A